jgi:hypothetical protein
VKKIIAAIAIIVAAPVTSHAADASIRTQVLSVKEHKPSVMPYLNLAQEDRTYVLKKDANYRIGPNSVFHHKGTLEKGEIIESVGRARSWVAFEKEGSVFFIWEGLLNPWKSWPSSTVTASE